MYMMKLLAAVDLSKASGYVIEAVHRVASATDAEVYVLHTIIPLPGIAGPEFNPVTEYQEMSERYQDEQDQLNELVSQLVDVDVNATALMVQGDPAKTILTEAERLDAELVVIGSHGHGMMFDALVGSISAGILRKSTIPVLVVPVRGL
jgi:nucleotide-binding universal stress UspA family protein